MKRRRFFGSLGAAALFTGLFPSKISAMDPALQKAGLKKGEIQHMVIFNLPYQEGSKKAIKFLNDGNRILTGIPVVRDFQVFLQVSPKNDYQYGFSMVFTNQADYQTYNDHPDHVAFVEERWKIEVTDFLEIDFKSPY
jgi:hypothetical protein